MSGKGKEIVHFARLAVLIEGTSTAATATAIAATSATTTFATLAAVDCRAS